MNKKILKPEEIKAKYAELVKEGPVSNQKRGFEFESLIYSILYNEGLEPRASYRLEGEQVDGSFFWCGQTFLLEAKWIKNPLPASSIYAFKGKLDGKFHTSSGIFISVNGFSKDVEDALKFGKSLNIILFDETDVPIIFNGKATFLDVLKFKLRAAGDTGSLQVSYELKEKAKSLSQTFAELLNMDEYKDKTLPVSDRQIRVDDLLVFVEGKSDVGLIKNFIEPIKKSYSLSYRIQELRGERNVRDLPTLISIYGDYQKTKAVITILDDDQLTNETNDVINNIEDQFKKASIYVETLFLFISESLKIKLSDGQMSLDELRNEQVFKKLETFIQKLAEEYYDPQIAIPEKTLSSSMEGLEWNYEDQTVDGFDEYDQFPFSLKTLDELVTHLDNEIVNAMHATMPTFWLKELDDALDYSMEVRQFLAENYLKEIGDIGWDTTEL